MRQQDITVILAVHLNPRVNSKNISSVIPIVDRATDTITDLLNVKRVRSSLHGSVCRFLLPTGA